MKILTYKWKAYNQADIEAALRKRGHIVEEYEQEMQNFEADEEFRAGFVKALCGNADTSEGAVYDLVFTVNYFPLISDICEDFGVKYICWTCDSPLSTLYHDSVFNSCNYIFSFDKICSLNFTQRGANMYHLPLAAAVERADTLKYEVLEKVKIEGQNNAQDKSSGFYEEECDYEMGKTTKTIQRTYESAERIDNADESIVESKRAGECNVENAIKNPMYRHEVSFIGSMYRKNSYDEICDLLPDYVRGYFDALMRFQMEIYGESYIDDMLTAEIIDELNKHFRIEKSERSFSDISLIFSTTVLGFKIAQMERHKLINSLSKHFDVAVYTDDEQADFLFARNMGPADYWSASPLIFYQSKINLNFTIRNIKSGIPLRVWDILAAGGFCITNFQMELPLYFENGVDLVWFEDEKDLIRKVAYYLEHDEERIHIARNGYKKVKKLHNYDARFDEMTRLSGIKI